MTRTTGPSAERVLMRGRRGRLVVTVDRKITDDEFLEAVDRWQPVLVLEGLHVEAYIPPARPRRRQGLLPRWAR